MQLLKSFKLLTFLLVMPLILSCDDDVVGKWDPMKWEYKNVSEGIKIIKGGSKDQKKQLAEIEVTKSGSVDIICKNYKGFWFEEYPDMQYGEEYRYQFDTECCEMKIEGNTLHCDFYNIESHEPEKFQIVVTAGDIFFTFIIDIK